MTAFSDGPMLVISHEGNTYTLHDTVEDRQVVHHMAELVFPTRMDPHDVVRSEIDVCF